MKLYQGTKQIKAHPMSRGEYNDYRGWAIPDDENPSEPGYLIEYTNGGKANDTRHEGYISWSPANVFEDSYQPVVASALPPHQQRVYQEHAELNDKVVKLNAFFSTNIFTNLPEDEKSRLMSQVVAMTSYLTILKERIANFPPPN